MPPCRNPSLIDDLRLAMSSPYLALRCFTSGMISTYFNTKQRVFLDCVLSHYVSESVGELDQDKLTPLLRLKYHDSIADAVADLGKPKDIGRVFAGFQNTYTKLRRSSAAGRVFLQRAEHSTVCG